MQFLLQFVKTGTISDSVPVTVFTWTIPDAVPVTVFFHGNYLWCSSCYSFSRELFLMQFLLQFDFTGIFLLQFLLSLFAVQLKFMHQKPREARSHFVSILPAFYGTRRFITAFKRARHWSLSWARWIQSTPSHTISPKSVRIVLQQDRKCIKNTNMVPLLIHGDHATSEITIRVYAGTWRINFPNNENRVCTKTCNFDIICLGGSPVRMLLT
jgi:hypothetical protein